MKLSFDTIEEVQEFVKRLKTTRGGKGEKEEAETTTAQQTTAIAPPPMQPPNSALPAQQGFPGTGGFAPPAGGAAPAGGGFPVDGATGPVPEVQALVTRIITKLDQSIGSGASGAEQALQWFRGQCSTALGENLSAANMDQIKSVCLPKMTVPALENIAKQMNA